MQIVEIFISLTPFIWIKNNQEFASALGTVASGVSSVISLIGLIFIWWQLSETRKIAQQQFEDSMAKEYRELINRIPTKVMLGEELEVNEFKENFDEFYRYFDLTNEQILLNKRNRIHADVWGDWLEGIEANIQLPAFNLAWEQIEFIRKKNGKENPFKELKKILDEIKVQTERNKND